MWFFNKRKDKSQKVVTAASTADNVQEPTVKPTVDQARETLTHVLGKQGISLNFFTDTHRVLTEQACKEISTCTDVILASHPLTPEDKILVTSISYYANEKLKSMLKKDPYTNPKLQKALYQLYDKIDMEIQVQRIQSKVNKL